jgi:DNA-binding NarL/FixJ family response regulator
MTMTEEQVAKILDDYKNGKTYKQIAVELACSPMTICLYVRKAGISRPRGRQKKQKN